MPRETLSTAQLARSGAAPGPDGARQRATSNERAATQPTAAQHTLAARIQSTGHRRARDESRRFWESIRAQRLDAGISLGRLAPAAGISRAYLFDLEAGEAIASLDVSARVAAALGGEASLRYFPGTGPRLRDHLQASMIDAFLRILDHRWGRRLEVAVAPPLRGFVDLVLDDATVRLRVAVEFQSGIRRVEQELRWAQAKAKAMSAPQGEGQLAPQAEAQWTPHGAAMLGPHDAGTEGSPTDSRPGPWTTSRLLVLRSTARTRQVVASHAELFQTAYPARLDSALAALTTASAPWPGPAMLWMRVEGGEATLLDRLPRGVRVGR